MNNDLIVEIERDIIKKFRKHLWSKFVRALQDYKMIEANDVVCCAISGGKDSLLLAKLLQEVQRHGNIPFELKFLAMDPGYTKENRDLLEYNCKVLGIPVVIINSDVFEIAEILDKDAPCYMCAKMRRGFLYRHAQEMGCNKLALGHHFDDLIETTLLNIFYAGCFKTMAPKIKAQNFTNMELIRPLIYIHEKDIIRFMKTHNVAAMMCGCKVTKEKLPSKRAEMKKLIADLNLIDENIAQNIFKSSENVNLEAILGFTYKNKKIDFNDIYEREILDELE